MLIAVIGHGRSPEGRGWGKKINKCDCVIRMWDWTWQPSTDYGTRYDYGLFVLTSKGLGVFNANYTGPPPNKGWLAYQGKLTPGELPYGAIEILKTVDWHEEIQKVLGGAGTSGDFTLTRGGAAACWAIEQAGRTRKGEVILVGFDNVKLGYHLPKEQSFCPEYWKLYIDRFKPNTEKVFPEYASKTNTHDLEVEYQFLTILADRHEVKLSIAVEKWSHERP